MTGRRRYLITRSHVANGVTIIDELHLMDAAELIAAAGRVCDRKHLHDSGEHAAACDALPGPPPVGECGD